MSFCSSLVELVFTTEEIRYPRYEITPGVNSFWRGRVNGEWARHSPMDSHLRKWRPRRSNSCRKMTKAERSWVPPKGSNKRALLFTSQRLENQKQKRGTFFAHLCIYEVFPNSFAAVPMPPNFGNQKGFSWVSWERGLLQFSWDLLGSWGRQNSMGKNL